MQMMHASDRLIVESDNQIALSQSSALRWAVFLNRNNKDTRLERQTIKSDDPPVNWHVLPSYADVTAPDSSVADEPSSNQLGRVTCDRETDALRWSNHCRVYAYDLAG